MQRRVKGDHHMSGNRTRVAAGSFIAVFVLLCVSMLALPLSSVCVFAQSPSAANKPQGKDPLAKNAPGLQIYLRRLFENVQIRVVQTDKRNADVFVGDRLAGVVEVDDVDDDAFSILIEIPEGEAAQEKKLSADKVQAYLRSLFGSAKLRATLAADGEVEVHADKREIGDVYYEHGSSAKLILIVFEDDLPVAPEAIASEIEPIDAANSTMYARTSRVPVRELPNEEIAPVTYLSEGQQVKVTGKTKTSSRAPDRWFRVEFADGKARYVLGRDLLVPKDKDAKLKYRALEFRYARFLDQIGISQGGLAKYMGFYTVGRDCMLRPRQVPPVFAGDKSSQRLQDLQWAISAWTIWTDGNHIFVARVEGGEIARFKPAHIRTMKTKDLGVVRFFRLDRLEPPGLDDDFAVTGFADNGKVLIGVQLEGDRFKYRPSTRCNDLTAVRSALGEFYKSAPANLSEPR
jgi:hypothetical protein